MKTNLNSTAFIFFIAVLCTFKSYSAITVTLTKENSNVPDNVCNLSSYKYIATVSGFTGSYTVSFENTYETSTVVSTSTNGYITTGTIKWTANTGTNGYKGELKAKLRYNNTDYFSAPLAVTIKSIKHLTATFTGIPTGSPWNLSPCESGTLNLEAGNMYVPGTGDIFPEKVNSFAWLVPNGWTLNGLPQDGTTWKITGQNVTVTYPKSNISGSIKVKASYLTACGDLQESKESTVFTVNRAVAFTISANQTYILCGDVTAVTFTVTPALPCALYYWNNSQTPTTNNYFQITPDGHSNITATVNVVYGTSNTNLSKTMQYQLFAPGVVPKITGNLLLCNGVTETYNVSNLRPGYTVTWSVSQNLNLTTVGNSALISSSSIGTGIIHATVSSLLCGSQTVSDLYIQIGTPRPDAMLIDFDAPPGKFTAMIDGVPTATSYKWYCDGILNSSTSTIARFFRQIDNCEHVYYVDVMAVNACGVSALRHGEVSEPPCLYLNFTPNPGSNEVLLTLSSQVSLISSVESSGTANTASSIATDSQTVYTVRIFDNYGILYSTFTKTSDSFTIPVNNLKEGNYIVTVSNNVKNYSGKLMIKR